ncbi:MAG: hypothetical protein L0Y54_13370 [Sporichthyaceae bacterium]|nr:hypothetical protein [Sporichthyaceae bacterium]
MPDLRELLTAESERQRPHLIPPFEQLTARARRRTLRRAAVAAGTVAVLAVVTAGIALRPDSDRTRPAGEPDWTVATACPGWSPDPAQQGLGVRLPEDLRPITEAFVCATTSRAVPGDGQWQFQEARRIVGGLPELLAAYQMPDLPRPNSCTWDIDLLPTVWLHSSSVVGVRAPLDGCMHSSELAATAFQKLTTVMVASEPIRQQTTQLALDSGCDQDAENRMANRDYDSTGAAPMDVPEALSLEPHRVCSYDDDGSEEAWQLVAAANFDTAQIAQFDAALREVRQDPSCERGVETMFTVIYPPGDDGGLTTYVAVDGCAVQQLGSYWRATEELRALLPRPD